MYVCSYCVRVQRERGRERDDLLVYFACRVSQGPWVYQGLLGHLVTQDPSDIMDHADNKDQRDRKYVGESAAGWTGSLSLHFVAVLQGEPGFTGIEGPQGRMGSKGPMGLPGATGRAGRDGRKVKRKNWS